MSADLFAEFGSTPSQQQQSANPGQGKAQPAPAFSFFDELAGTASVSQTQSQPQAFKWPETKSSIADGNDDDWGDFEGDGSSAAQKGQDSVTAASHFQSPQTSWQPAPVIKAKKSTDPSVLFDAESGYDAEDDFGDFEGEESNSTAPAAPAITPVGLVDVLDGMAVSQPAPPIVLRTTTKDSNFAGVASSATRNIQVGRFGSATALKQAPTPAPKSASTNEDSWDTFDDWEASIPTKGTDKYKQSVGNASDKTSAQQPNNSISSEDPLPGELPPTNVPPPGVLLSLFPPLFAEAQDRLFRPMAAQTLPMRNKILSDPATITYLQSYLMLASVAARVMAGRKLRWKRDTYLSQGMKIGPATSRATSGMKLTGVDRSENMKEEREASDVVRAWKDQVGKLRHVLSGANQAKPGSLGAAPDIQEVMPVRTLKQAEGGIPARQPCRLCGLKREERLGAVDQGIVDSFGEWWIDQVNMHRGISGTNTKASSGSAEMLTKNTRVKSDAAGELMFDVRVRSKMTGVATNEEGRAGSAEPPHSTVSFSACGVQISIYYAARRPKAT